MEEIETKFTKDIQELLSSYFDQSQLNFFFKKSIGKDIKSSSLETINKFYAQQLNVEYNFANARIEIDRTITFAMKNLNIEKYLELLRRLGKICTGYGKLNLAFEVLNKALKESKNQKDKAESLLLLADVHSRRADWKKSIEDLRNARDLFNSIGDVNGSSMCENILGSIYGERGQIEEAKIHFKSSLQSINIEDEKELAASAESNLGIIENIQGNYAIAFEYFKNSIRKFESLGNYRKIAELKHNIGMLYVNQKKYNEAVEEFDQCIQISLKEGFLTVLGMVYLSKANTLIKLKKFDAALLFTDKSMEISHQIDDKLTIADIYKTKSLIEKHQKNFEKAENYLQSSLLLNKKMNNILNIAESYFELAVLYDELNRKQEKEEYLHQSLKYFREVRSVEYIQKIEEMLSSNTSHQVRKQE